MTRRAPPPAPQRDDDELLTTAEVARLLKIHRTNVMAYARHHPVLLDGLRWVRVKKQDYRGCPRFLRSAVLQHMAEEIR